MEASNKLTNRNPLYTPQISRIGSLKDRPLHPANSSPSLICDLSPLSLSLSLSLSCESRATQSPIAYRSTIVVYPSLYSFFIFILITIAEVWAPVHSFRNCRVDTNLKNLDRESIVGRVLCTNRKELCLVLATHSGSPPTVHLGLHRFSGRPIMQITIHLLKNHLVVHLPLVHKQGVPFLVVLLLVHLVPQLLHQ
ncbi:hypothetical protein L1887_27436 [Cichorium endivia]|nr:hypothetical protein L1887_27436 [Cichorium endivia]